MGPSAENQRLLSGPRVIWRAMAPTGNSVNTPSGVTFAIVLPAVTQRLPSGPGVMSKAPDGDGYSVT